MVRRAPAPGLGGNRVRLPELVIGRLRSQVPQMTARMAGAILEEVPLYSADPDAYRAGIRQLCRLAVRIFIRIVETGQPPGAREVGVVQRVGANVAAAGQPLEPLLHALRIGARVGWDDTLAVSLSDPRVPRDDLLVLAGQVFEYIDQLSSRIAEAYAQQVEESARAQALSESALFEDLVAGRVTEAVPSRVALALCGGGADRAAARQAVEVVAGRLRTRFPQGVVGRHNGLPVWLLAREPLPSLLADCAGSEPVAFGISAAADGIPLSRAVDEAVVAARLGLELDRPDRVRAYGFPALVPYAALRADPAALARFQADMLGPVLQQEVLLDTLRHYFASGRSVSRTAQRVHRHRQSVIYRLQRASRLLGVALDDAESMFRLEAAVRTLI
jgi:hypothetical protein